MTHLRMKCHDFISSTSIVMAPDLKTRPRTDGRGGERARAVVNRPSFIASVTLQLSRKGTLALLFVCLFVVVVVFLFFFCCFSDKFGLICRTSAVL